MTGDKSSARTCSEEARVKADSLGEKASGMEKNDDSNFQPEPASGRGSLHGHNEECKGRH